MNLIENGKALPLLVEAEAFEGVRRIAAAVAGDVELVTGVRPEVLSEYTGGSAILCATLGKSPLAEQLEKEGRFSAEEIRGKREVYKIAFVGELLVIVGSDKRGTIDGMHCPSTLGSPRWYTSEMPPLQSVPHLCWDRRWRPFPRNPVFASEASLSMMSGPASETGQCPILAGSMPTCMLWCLNFCSA